MQSTPRKTNLKTSPQKSTPLGGLRYAAMPYFGRRMELIELKQAVRTVLANRHDSGEVERRLGSFAPVRVRGDFVPTLAEGYEAILDAVNARPPTRAHNSIYPSAPCFRVEVRIVPVWQTTKDQ